MKIYPLKKIPKLKVKAFWSLVLKFHPVLVPAGCWHWFGVISPQRYGRFRVNGRYFGAHRVAYFLSKGQIPDGLYICHSCDNPRCVNPSHLWAGTALDNVRDMIAKGRARYRGKKDAL